MAESNPAIGIAEAIQAAHIKHNPDPKYDANPSTAASKKSPVRLRSHPLRRPSAGESSEDAAATVKSDEVPISVLEPPRRKQNLPPLPDLRFEQSYLARVKPAADAGQYGQVAWITFIDHVVMPLSQGIVWNILLHGWRAWNGAAQFQGRGVGAKIRRWWWKVNNWKVPEPPKVKAEHLKEFHIAKFGNAGVD